MSTFFCRPTPAKKSENDALFRALPQANANQAERKILNDKVLRLQNVLNKTLDQLQVKEKVRLDVICTRREHHSLSHHTTHSMLSRRSSDVLRLRCWI